VKVELQTDEKAHVDVEVATPAFNALDLKRGDRVWFALRGKQEYAPDFAI
jgi:hypothetical protein